MNTMPEQEHLGEITESVWSGFLDIPLIRTDAPFHACECASSIQIEGAWNGSVIVGCSRRLARRVAAAMFHCEPGELEEPLWEDALNEIANIIGGNIKALLPAPSRLHLPRYHRDWQAPAEAQTVSFRSGDELLYILLIDDSA